MAQIREIKKRIRAVGNIQRITKTMQMIATARFKTSLDRAAASQPYTEKVRELVTELARAGGEVSHPLFETPDPPAGRELLLVLTADRGLCGAYNSNVLRTAMGHMRETEEEVRLEVVGKKGMAFFRFANRSVSLQHTQFGDKPAYEAVEALAERFIEEFEARTYDRISLAYMKFISAGRQRPVVETLLPLSAPEADEGLDPDRPGVAASGELQYDYSPDRESLFAELLPITVKTSLYQAFNDAVVSEHVARMVAMKAATDNAGKLRKELRRTFNRARQTQITTELSEIIGGAASLE